MVVELSLKLTAMQIVTCMVMTIIAAVSAGVQLIIGAIGAREFHNRFEKRITDDCEFCKKVLVS